MRSRAFALAFIALAGCTSVTDAETAVVVFNARDEKVAVDVLVTIEDGPRTSRHEVGAGESVEAPRVPPAVPFTILVQAAGLGNSAVYEPTTRPPFLIACVGATSVDIIAARDLSLLPKLQARDVEPPRRPSCLGAS